MTMNEQQADTDNHYDGPVSSPPLPESNTLPPPPPQQQLIIPGQRLPYSNAQPVWQFVLLNICTFCLYQLAWFYFNWHLLKTQRRLKVTPIARSIFAPLFIWSFLLELQQLVKSSYTWPLDEFGPLVLATCYFLQILLARILQFVDNEMEGISALTLIMLLVSYSTILPLIPAVRAVNVFWANKQPGQPMRNSLSAGAIVTVVIGGMLLLLVLSVVLIEITGQV